MCGTVQWLNHLLSHGLCWATLTVLSVILQWSSYDRTWFSGHDKQEIFILISTILQWLYCRLSHCAEQFLLWVKALKHQWRVTDPLTLCTYRIKLPFVYKCCVNTELDFWATQGAAIISRDERMPMMMMPTMMSMMMSMMMMTYRIILCLFYIYKWIVSVCLCVRNFNPLRTLESSWNLAWILSETRVDT
jgi:hypothetical protein